MSRVYRLKVNKIKLDEDIPIKRAQFPPMGELYLDLIETKQKVKKDAPKPVSIIPEPVETDENVDYEKVEKKNTPSFQIETKEEDDDFALKELELLYNENMYENESIKNSVSSNEEESEEDEKSESDEVKEKEHSTNGKNASDYMWKFEKNEEETEEEKEEKERIEKNEIIDKLAVLKKKYDGVEIPDDYINPDIAIHKDYRTLKDYYDKIIRRVSLDSNVQWYREILGYSFFGIEFVSVQFLNIDMTGFYDTQLNTLNSYDNLLYELGEKTNVTIGSKFPVEVRLIGYVLLNAVMFYFQKSKGGDLTSIMSAFMKIKSKVNHASPTNMTTNTFHSPQKQAGKMRGPTIHPNDVRQMHSKNE